MQTFNLNTIEFQSRYDEYNWNKCPDIDGWPSDPTQLCYRVTCHFHCSQEFSPFSPAAMTLAKVTAPSLPDIFYIDVFHFNKITAIYQTQVKNQTCTIKRSIRVRAGMPHCYKVRRTRSRDPALPDLDSWNRIEKQKCFIFSGAASRYQRRLWCNDATFPIPHTTNPADRIVCRNFRPRVQKVLEDLKIKGFVVHQHCIIIYT